MSLRAQFTLILALCAYVVYPLQIQAAGEDPAQAAAEAELVAALKAANPAFDGRVFVRFDKDGALNTVRIQDKPGTITDLTPISKLPLTTFALDGGAITSVDALRGLQLTTVALTNCKSLTDVSALSGMPIRSAVFYGSSQLADISGLADANLSYINTERTSVADISPIAGQPLYNARLCSPKLTDFSPLAGTKTLKVLDLSFAAGVTDLSPVKTMPNLMDLRMDEAEVTDLSPLTSLENLLLLSIKDCPSITDLTPLREIESLRVLVFTPANMTAEQLDFIRTQLPQLTFIDADYRNWNNRHALNPTPETPVCTPAAEFWRKLDAGEYAAAATPPSPAPQQKPAPKKPDAAADTAAKKEAAQRAAEAPPSWHKTQAGKPTNENYAVRTNVVVTEDPMTVQISWAPIHNGVEAPVEIFRRTDLKQPWGEPIATLPAGTTDFTDDSDGLAAGNRYEYKIKTGTDPRNTAYGYLAVGARIPLVESRGKVLLIVDETMAEPLAPELERLTLDLVGDGWQVAQHSVPRDQSRGMPYMPGTYLDGEAATSGDPADVVKVKAIIKAEYDAAPQLVKAAILIGRVPQPYSGDRAFDTHKEHRGAWPTDAYYADMDGEWTDETVDYNYTWTLREKDYDSRNRNHPGDYRWDQTTLPSDLELQVGRIDLWGFEETRHTGPQPKSETELVRQYLDKDHAFRHGRLPAERRGLISDGYNTPGFCTALTGWMGFSALFGQENVRGFHQAENDAWMNELKTNSYLFGLACGYGTRHGVSGVGSKYGKEGPGTTGTGRFIQWDPKVAFLFMSGSWFSDYDQPGNFMRAPLAAPTYGLTNAWSATPLYFIHHMALGDTIGQTSLVSHNQDNSPATGYAHFYEFLPRGISSSLLGDPTLRLHPVAPPSALTIATAGGATQLSWQASTDEQVLGYHVYRAADRLGPYTALTTAPLATTSWTDPAPVAGEPHYMVRAIKLETSGSGTYYNASQGVFADRP